MGVIHMNGRVYDPAINRFLSVDPVIQDAKNLQSYNAYSYLNNNPLNATDPSGYQSYQTMPTVNVTASRGNGGSSWGDGWGSSWGGIGGYGSATYAYYSITNNIDLYYNNGGRVNPPGSSVAPTVLKKSDSKKSIGNGKGLLSKNEGEIPELAEVPVTAERESLTFSGEVIIVAGGKPYVFDQGIGGGFGGAVGGAPIRSGVVGSGTKIYTDPRNLIPTEKPSGSVVKRLSKDMKENGYDENYPISATMNSRGRLEITDGHHRRDAAIKAGVNKVPVIVD